jgi:hypothetical protein
MGGHAEFETIAIRTAGFPASSSKAIGGNMRGLIFAAIALTATASAVHAQSTQSPRLVGTAISGHLDMKGDDGTIVETATLVFPGGDGRPAFTVDFVAQYVGTKPLTPASVIDIVITHLPPNDDRPDVAMQINGQPMELVTRLRSRRSVVASISFNEFLALANADTIVERAFDTELEFGPAQRRLLREAALRWSRK